MWLSNINNVTYDFKWVGDISEPDKRFIKNCIEESDEGYFLEVGI